MHQAFFVCLIRIAYTHANRLFISLTRIAGAFFEKLHEFNDSQANIDRQSSRDMKVMFEIKFYALTVSCLFDCTRSASW